MRVRFHMAMAGILAAVGLSGYGSAAPDATVVGASGFSGSAHSAKATPAKQQAGAKAIKRREWSGASAKRCTACRLGWSVPEGKRRAEKRRNQLRHKARKSGR